MTQDELRAALLLLGFNCNKHARNTYIYTIPGKKYRWLVVRFINDTEVSLEYREPGCPDDGYFRTITPREAFNYIKEKLT